MEITPRNGGAHWEALVRAADRAVAVVEEGLMYVTAFAFALTIGITVVDVTLRYGFGTPLPWAYTLIGEYLMVAGFFCAVSQTLRKRQHVNVDVFANMLPVRVRHLILALTGIGALLFFGVMFWQGALITYEAIVNNEVQVAAISWYKWPSKAFVPLGIGVLLTRIAVNIAGHCAVFAGVSVGDLESLRIQAAHADPKL